MTSNGNGRLVVTKMFEQRRRTGHGQVQVLTDLTEHDSSLLDQVPQHRFGCSAEEMAPAIPVFPDFLPHQQQIGP